jgi:hypothetical protein
MLSGEVPFNSITTHRTAEEIVEDITRSKLSYDSPAWKNVSQAAKDLVKGLFDFLLNKFIRGNQKKRFSVTSRDRVRTGRIFCIRSGPASFKICPVRSGPVEIRPDHF